MKKFLLPLMAALLLPLAAAPAYADSAISIRKQDVVIDFPKQITFTLNAASTSEIQDVTLVVRFPDVTRRIVAKFTPGTDVQVQVEWGLESEDASTTGGYLPPGVSAQYTWIVQDAAGNKLETEPQTLFVTDTRLPWQTVEDDKLAIRWYGADKQWGQAVFDAGIQTLSMVREELGATTGGKVHIWFYTDREDFRTSMPDMNDWTGGRSFGNYRAILLLTDGGKPQEAIEGARHELTHQVVYDSLGGGLARNAFPHWLNEGLATYNQFNGGALPDYMARPLSNAIATDTLPRLKSRDANFPADSTEALTSYAMSFAVTDLLFKKFGQAKVNEIYKRFQDGDTPDKALMAVIGVDTDGLDNLYRKSVGLQERNYSTAGIPTAAARPTFSLSSAETSVPNSNANATPTPRTVSVANTPAPAAVTPATNSAQTEQQGGAPGLSVCGVSFGGLALAMFGAYEWRKRRPSSRL